MKIMFFISQMGQGGAENVVATLTSQLALRGHDVILVSHLKNQFYDISEKVKVLDSRSWQYDTFVGSYPVRIYKKAANRFRHYHNLRRILKQEQPDLVISFLCSSLLFLIPLCGKKIPIISAERNAMIFPHGRSNFLSKQILYRMVYGVQVMSRHDKAWLRGRYKRVYPMPNPLRFDPLSKEQYDAFFEHRKGILACGRVDSQKGFEKLILAFSKIAQDFPDWTIDICGSVKEDNYYHTLVNLVEKLGLKDRINFMGVRKDVDKLMQAHSVFCLSSQHEGFPNVLSEAMANGMACVSFDIVTGPSEIIVDGIDGIIVEDQNVDELAKGLNSVLVDKELRYSLGVHAIDNISRFRRDRIVDKWENLFSNIIKEFKNEKN